MDERDIAQLIRETVAEKTETVDADFDADADFAEDLGIDSLVALEIIVDVERELKIKIPPERYDEFSNLNDAVALVQEF